MAMPEPRDPHGFWDSVKDKSIDQLWPPDDENDAWDLADEWRAAATLLEGTADKLAAQANVSHTVWTDLAGAQYWYVLRNLPENFRLIAQNMRTLADGVHDYGNQIREARISILTELAVNIGLFVGLSMIPGGGFLAAGLARAVAGRLSSMIIGMTGRTLAGGLARALQLGGRLGVELGKEAFDEAFIDLTTQITSKAMGTRKDIDLSQTAKAAATGAVGGVLGEGLGKVLTPLNKVTDIGLSKVMPDSVARNLNSGLSSALNNAVTSPSAGYIVENYDDPSALTNVSGYTDAVKNNGLAAGLVGAPRSMVIDGVQQMKPGGEALVNNWADRFAGNTQPPAADPGARPDTQPGGDGPKGENQPASPPPGENQPGGPRGGETQSGGGPQTGETQTGQTQTGGPQAGETQTGGQQTGETQTGGPQAGETQTSGQQTGGTGAETGGTQTGATESGGTQTGGTGAETGGTQTGGTDAGSTSGSGADTSTQAGATTETQAGGTDGAQAGSSTSDSGGQAGSTTDTSGTQSGGTDAGSTSGSGADTGGSQTGSSTSDTGSQTGSTTDTGSGQTGAAETGGSQTDSSTSDTGDQSGAATTDTSAGQSGSAADSGGTQSAAPNNGSSTTAGPAGTTGTGAAAVGAAPMHGGASPAHTTSAAPAHPAATAPGQATTAGQSKQTSTPTSAGSPASPASPASKPDAKPAEETTPEQSTNETAESAPPQATETTPETAAPQMVVTASGAAVAMQAAAASVPPDGTPTTTTGPKPTHTRATRPAPAGERLASWATQPDVTPSQPLRTGPHSLGTFAEERLTRDAAGGITLIDGIPVQEKLRQLAETRVEQYWNAQRYDDKTRFEGRGPKKQPAAPFDTELRQQPDIPLNFEYGVDESGEQRLTDRNQTGNVVALAVDLRTGEVFEAVNGPTDEADIQPKIKDRMAREVLRPEGYASFDDARNPVPGQRSELPFGGSAPFSHAEVRTVNEGMRTRPDAEFKDFVTDVQFLRGKGVKPAWYCGTCAALLHDVETNAGKRVYYEDDQGNAGYRDEPGYFGDDPRAPLRVPGAPPPDLPPPLAPHAPGPPSTPPSGNPSAPPDPTTPSPAKPPAPAGTKPATGTNPSPQPPPTPPTNTNPTTGTNPPPTPPNPAGAPTAPSGASSPAPTTANSTATGGGTVTPPQGQSGQNASGPPSGPTPPAPTPTPGPLSRVHSVKAVPHSKFAVEPTAGFNHAEVKVRAQTAILSIGPDSGVRSVDRVGWNQYEVTRLDGTSFRVRVIAQVLNDDTVAEVVVTGPNQVEIRISGQAKSKVVDRAVANAVAQASQVLAGTQTDQNLLVGNRHPGSRTEISAEDHGRQAEVRNLDRTKQETPRWRMWRRRQIATEMKALVEHLGLHPDDEVAPQRRAVADPEVATTIDQHTKPGSRRPSWATAPDGYPTWRSFLVLHMPAEIAPGVAAGGAIAATGAPLVGGAVAVAATAGGISGTVIKRWYGRRDKTNTDSGHGVAIKIRNHEADLRRKQLLDPLLARMKTAGTTTPAPAEPAPDATMPPKYQSYPARLLARGGPAIIGAGAASTLMFAGLPLWNAAAHWGVALVAATFGPVVEKFLRNKLVAFEWASLDNVGREKDEVAADFEEKFVAQLSALLDRIEALAGGTPAGVAPTADPVRPSEINKVGTTRYGANQSAGQSGDIARATADAGSKILPAKPVAPSGNQTIQQVQQSAVNAAIDSLLTGGTRALLGTIINAFLDRQFITNEYKEIVGQVHHDFGNKMREQVVTEQRLINALMAELTTRVDAAEAAVNRVNSTYASRVADLRAATPPAPAPVPDSKRPVGHQRWQAFLKLHTKQALTMEGLMIGAAVAFDQGTAGPIVIGAVATMIASAFGLRYLFRHAEQVAVDETIFADRAKERPVEQAEADARQRFLTEFFADEIAAATAGQTAPHPRPTAPAVPTHDHSAAEFPDHIDEHVAHERAMLRHEPRPWSLLGKRLVALDRLTVLTQRVRDFTAYETETGDSRPVRQARNDLKRLWDGYQDLVRDGKPLPTDHELLSERKPEGTRAAHGTTPRSQPVSHYLDNSVATPAGRAFHLPGDELYAEADQVPAVPGQYTIDAHGAPDHLVVGGERLTPADVAEIIRADPNWRGEPIRLLACRTGQDPTGFASQLADLLGVRVYAPTSLVALHPVHGLIVTAYDPDMDGVRRPVIPPTGGFGVFEPTSMDPNATSPGPPPPTGPVPAAVSPPAPVPHGSRGLYLPEHEDIRFGELAEVTPVEELGELTLMRHGPSVYTGADRLWPDELADLVGVREGWVGGPLRLQVRDGHLDGEFVQRLADLLGVPVTIPAKAVAGDFPTLSSGTLEVYNEPPSDTPAPGTRVFAPKIVTAVKGMS